MTARPALVAAWILIVAATSLALISFNHYPGSAWRFWSFHAAFVALAAAVLRQPLGYGAAALAAFLTLGHWLKVMTLFAFGAQLIEPTGAFDGSAASWDRALGLITAGIVGTTAAVLLGRWMRRADRPDLIRVPDLYLRHARAVWIATGVVIVTLAAWNLPSAFAMIGVNLRRPLPARLHIAVAYWIFFGSGIWIAVLLSWHRAAHGALHSGWLAIPFLEGLITSTTALSRSIFLFRLAPYVLTSATGESPIRRPAGRHVLLQAAVLVAGLAASVVATSLARAYVYPPPEAAAIPDAPQAMAAEDVPAAPAGTAAPAMTALEVQRYQVPRLFLARWTGLEGVLVFASMPEDARPAFSAILAEDPARGTDAIFQNAAHSHYEARTAFTFLTLAGIAGIAASQGSAPFAAAVMFAGAALLILIEGFARRMIGGGLVGAATGVMAANVIAQTTFPYSTAVILLETAAFIAVVGIVVRVAPGARYPEARLPASDSSRHQASS